MLDFPNNNLYVPEPFPFNENLLPYTLDTCFDCWSLPGAAHPYQYFFSTSTQSLSDGFPIIFDVVTVTVGVLLASCDLLVVEHAKL